MSDYNGETYESPLEKVMNFFTWKKIVSLSMVGFLSLVAYDGIFQTHLGYNYVVQDTALGTTRFFSSPGIKFKIPFASKVTEYKQVATVGFSNKKTQARFTSNNPAVEVTFADTYNGDVPATFRFKLPVDEVKMLALHKEFRTFDNLVESLLVKNARDVVVVTATQYTGEEFFQGGLNSFKVKLKDQLRNGLYSTERRQVSVEESDLAAVTSDDASGTRIEKRLKLIWKNVTVKDDDGKDIRESNPLSPYGITVSQVTIDKPSPEGQLNKMLVTKKTLVAERIAAEQQISTAEAQAKAVQTTMEIDKRKAIQLADKVRELAIIDGQKRVAVEQQNKALLIVTQNKLKEVAIIERLKVLEIANANKNIQKANSEAAIFEARAIREVGIAEADVARAKLAAKESSKEIYMAELQKNISLAMYGSLRDFKITMPQNVVMGGGSGSKLPNSLDTLTTFGLLGTMEKISKIMPVANQKYTPAPKK